LGIILYALLSGKLPFKDSNKTTLFKKIIQCEYEIPSELSNASVELIKTMLVADPLKRITIDKIKLSKWVNEEYLIPPVSYIPHRYPLKAPLDENILRAMKPYGFDASAAEIILNDVDSAAFAIYYLIKEREEHSNREQEAVESRSSSTNSQSSRYKDQSKHDLSLRRQTFGVTKYVKTPSHQGKSDSRSNASVKESAIILHEENGRRSHQSSQENERKKRASNASNYTSRRTSAVESPRSIPSPHLSHSSVSVLSKEKARFDSVTSKASAVSSSRSKNSFIFQLLEKLFTYIANASDSGLPREIRKINGTSIRCTKSVHDIIDQIMKGFNSIGVLPENISQPSTYIFECVAGDLTVSIEICRIKETSAHVLNFKRLSGGKGCFSVFVDSFKKSITV
jgi:hypothetical protein